MLPGAAARFCFKPVEFDGKFKLSAELARDHVLGSFDRGTASGKEKRNADGFGRIQFIVDLYG